ncbi:MAG: hypothetical protein MUC74_01935 [Ideonella sp.]|nr:hypothetical protein [Ideonella sp.]
MLEAAARIATTHPDADGLLAGLAQALSELAMSDTGALRLVESPMAALVRVAQSSALPLDADAVLGQWCASARQLLREVQGHPGQVLLLDADEVAAAPQQAMKHWMQRSASSASADSADRSGFEYFVSVAERRAARPSQALALAAAAAAVGRHGEADRLWHELQGTCQPLAAAGIAALDEDSAAALREWRDQGLRTSQLQRELESCRQRLTASEARLAESDEALAALRADAALGELLQRQAVDELSALAATAASAQAEAANLGLALAAEREAREHDSRRAVELQQQLEALQGVEAGQAADRSTKVNAELRSRVEGLVASLAAARQELDDMRAQLQRSSDAEARRIDNLARQLQDREAQIAALALERDGMAAELDEARRQRAREHGDLEGWRHALAGLQATAHSAAELARRGEASALAARRAAATLGERILADREARELLEAQLGDALADLITADLSTAGPPPADAATDDDPLHDTVALLRRAHCQLLEERLQRPHRELLFEVRLPQDRVLDGRTAAAGFELRLVEHEGRPGLVWLPLRGEAPPLHLWRPTGQEAGRDFMRLIPADVDDIAALAQLPPADWRLLRAAVRWLAEMLPASGAGDAAAWLLTAHRLARQLQAMPPRLRFSRVQATAPAVGSADPPQVVLGDTMFGDEALPDIRLSVDLRTDAPTSVVWHLPDTGEPPLASWPTGNDGRLLPRWALAIGHAAPQTGKHRWWAERPERDRALLLGLLEALPAAAEPLRGLVPEAALRRQAAQWHREARRLTSPQNLGTGLRRLRRLVGLGQARPGAGRA